MVFQIFEKGIIGRERPGQHIGGAVRPTPGGQDDLTVRKRIGVAEGAPQAAFALDLDDQRRQAAPRRHLGQGGADRRLADATLPGDDE
jgi:hypothetical protein